jgi:hypothetical protein
MGGFEKGFAQNFGSTTGRSSGYGAKMTEKEKAELKARRDAGFYDVETGDERTEREELGEDLSTAYGYKKGKADKLARGELYKGKPLKGAFVEEEGKAVKSRARKLKWESEQTKAKAQQEQVLAESDRDILEAKQSIPDYNKRALQQGLKQQEAKTRNETATAAKLEEEAKVWAQVQAQNIANDASNNATNLMRAQAEVSEAQRLLKQTNFDIDSAKKQTAALENIRTLESSIKKEILLGKPEGVSHDEWLSNMALKIADIPASGGTFKQTSALTNARGSLSAWFNGKGGFVETYKNSEKYKAELPYKMQRAIGMASIGQTEEKKAKYKQAQEMGQGDAFLAIEYIMADASKNNVPLNEKILEGIAVHRKSITKPFHTTYVDGREVPMTNEKTGALVVNYELDPTMTIRQYERHRELDLLRQKDIKVRVESGQYYVPPVAAKGGINFGEATPATEGKLIPKQTTTAEGTQHSGLAPLLTPPRPVHDPEVMQHLLDSITGGAAYDTAGEPSLPGWGPGPYTGLGRAIGQGPTQAEIGAAWDARTAAGLGADVEAFKEPVEYGFGEPEAPVAPVEPVAPAPVAPEPLEPTVEEARKNLERVGAELKATGWRGPIIDPNGFKEERMAVEEARGAIVRAEKFEKATAAKKESEASVVHARKAYSMMREGVDYARDKSSGTVYIEGGLTPSIRESFLRKYKYNSTQDRGINRDPQKLINSRIGSIKKDLSSYKSQLKIIEDELKHGRSVAVGRSGKGKRDKALRRLTIPERTAYIKRRDQLKSKITDVSGTIPEMEADRTMLSTVGKLKGKTISEEEARKLGIIK